jgi:hypothetical protein
MLRGEGLDLIRSSIYADKRSVKRIHRKNNFGDFMW